jgi:hypothetical protein
MLIADSTAVVFAGISKNTSITNHAPKRQAG